MFEIMAKSENKGNNTKAKTLVEHTEDLLKVFEILSNTINFEDIKKDFKENLRVIAILHDLGKANITEIPFNHICKILEFIGAELQKNTTGSQKRFYHPDCPTFGGYFGVHIIHKGKDDVSVAKQNFKTYILPRAREIIEILIERRKA